MKIFRTTLKSIIILVFISGFITGCEDNPVELPKSEILMVNSCDQEAFIFVEGEEIAVHTKLKGGTFRNISVDLLKDESTGKYIARDIVIVAGHNGAKVVKATINVNDNGLKFKVSYNCNEIVVENISNSPG
ncbi:MAG: hypothetical protein N4A72_00960 [Bacteroidales bacterium]|jgi:hypothetical protein|nr:hypothetical protein [Bacteroidales bacterium]